MSQNDTLKNKKLESFKSIGKFEVDISKEEYRKQESEYMMMPVRSLHIRLLVSEFIHLVLVAKLDHSLDLSIH